LVSFIPEDALSTLRFPRAHHAWVLPSPMGNVSRKPARGAPTRESTRLSRGPQAPPPAPPLAHPSTLPTLSTTKPRFVAPRAYSLQCHSKSQIALPSLQPPGPIPSAPELPPSAPQTHRACRCLHHAGWAGVPGCSGASARRDQTSPVMVPRNIRPALITLERDSARRGFQP